MNFLNNESKALKAKLLEMMKWFHHFCEENGLIYYALGGTMLGAVRHGGFIPWDDDIDVGMPRSDYEKLQTLLKTQKNSRYILESPYSENKDFTYPICKLYDTSTTLIEKRKKLIKRGVFIDIFPLDGLGNSKEECEKNFAPVKHKYDLILLKVTALRKGRSFIKNMMVLLFKLIPSFLFDDKKKIKELDLLCQKYDFNSCKWGGNLLGAWRLKEVMPVEILGKPKKYRFEDIEIYGAEDYNAYLTYLYGDWRKLPPKEKQVTHHDFVFLDTEKSYLD